LVSGFRCQVKGIEELRDLGIEELGRPIANCETRIR
jgi:hypothetical protein